MTTFSVIIPFYNAEATLEKCIRSVLSQTYNNFEIILIDDASEDKSMEIINKLNNDKIILITNKTNSLVGFSRNQGIDIAKGEYILFLDSDDFLAENALIQLIQKLKIENFPDIILFGYNIIIKSLRKGIVLTVKKCPTLLPNEVDWTKYLLLGAKGFKPMPWCYLYSSKLLKENKIKFPEGIYYEDVFFVIKAVFYSENLKVFEVPIYNYCCLKEDSITNKPTIQKIEDFISVHNLIDDFFLSHEKTDVYNNELIYKNIICIGIVLRMYLKLPKKQRSNDLVVSLKELLKSDIVTRPNLNKVIKIINEENINGTYYFIRLIKHFRFSFLIADLLYSHSMKNELESMRSIE